MLWITIVAALAICSIFSYVFSGEVSFSRGGMSDTNKSSFETSKLLFELSFLLTFLTSKCISFVLLVPVSGFSFVLLVPVSGFSFLGFLLSLDVAAAVW